LHRPVHEHLEVVACSGVFQNSAVLNDNWNKFLIPTDHKISSENSSRLLLRRVATWGAMWVMTHPFPNVEPKIFRLIKLLMCKPNE